MVDIRMFIRDASREDLPLVSKTVMAAAHMNDFPAVSGYDDEFVAICSRTDTLYSFKHARIMTVDGVAVGCMISYPGDIYAKARKVTFGMFSDVPEQMLEETGTEAFPGEWYLDSLAVVPAYRKFGIGKSLIEDAIGIGRRKGFQRFSLIVEAASADLQEYYASFGFKVSGTLTFFGDPYLRMTMTL